MYSIVHIEHSCEWIQYRGHIWLLLTLNSCSVMHCVQLAIESMPCLNDVDCNKLMRHPAVIYALSCIIIVVLSVLCCIIVNIALVVDKVVLKFVSHIRCLQVSWGVVEEQAIRCASFLESCSLLGVPSTSCDHSHSPPNSPRQGSPSRLQGQAGLRCIPCSRSSWWS